MTPLQRFYNQIPNGLANAFRNNWTDITGQTDGYFRLLLTQAELDEAKRTQFVTAARKTCFDADPELYYSDALLRQVTELSEALLGKEIEP